LRTEARLGRRWAGASRLPVPYQPVERPLQVLADQVTIDDICDH
jgi:hypothetical protein